jgi:hypothetical protein
MTFSDDPASAAALGPSDEPALVAGPAPSDEPAPPASLGWRAVLGGGLDLNVSAARHVRAASIRIGLLVLAAAGPLVVILLAVAARLDVLGELGGVGLDQRQVLLAIDAASGPMIVAFLIGGYCLAALSVDSQLLAVHLIASTATGRAFEPRSALQLVRMRFWRLLRANVLIAVILFLPRLLLEGVIAPSGVVGESQFVALTLLGIILSVPFAYVSALIILGAVGARESVRRSWRLARARPSLALVIAIVNVSVQTLGAFALGAGADLLARLASALGLDQATGLGLFVPLGAILGVFIIAAGSLLFTIAALTAAPQVVAYLGLAGTDNGLDALRDPDNPFATPHREPFVTRAMKVALVVEAIFAGLAVTRLS